NLIEKIVGIVRWQTFTYDSENRLVKTETMANSQVETTSSYQYDSCAKKAPSRAACTSTSPAAMRRSRVLINAKVKPKTRFITTTPTRSAPRWR
ncbi:YD repeat-containing protein, partial [Pseudomonas syringae pv. actinidiae ICMP 18807]